MEQISDKTWSHIRQRVDAGTISFEDVVRGLGKLSMESCVNAGMTTGEAQAIATLYDVLLGAAEIQMDSER